MTYQEFLKEKQGEPAQRQNLETLEPAEETQEQPRRGRPPKQEEN